MGVAAVFDTVGVMLCGYFGCWDSGFWGHWGRGGCGARHWSCSLPDWLSADRGRGAARRRELETCSCACRTSLPTGTGRRTERRDFPARWTIYGLFRSICPSSGGLNPRRAFSRFCDWLDGAVRTLVQDLVSRLSGMLSAGAVTLLGSLPSVLLFLDRPASLLLLFHGGAGGVPVGCRRIPSRWHAGLSRWQAGAGRSLRRYLRAALLLALLTFFGNVCRADSPAQAVCVSPGTAHRLCGLSACSRHRHRADSVGDRGSFLLGSTGSGLGILALYAISSVLRKSRRHLVGRSLGIHPLLSLLSMYAGFRLFGIPGMVLAPLAAAVIKGAGGREAAGKETLRGFLKEAPKPQELFLNFLLAGAGGLNPLRHLFAQPRGEDHLKRRRRVRRIVPLPGPPLLGCRHCS